MDIYKHIELNQDIKYGYIYKLNQDRKYGYMQDYNTESRHKIWMCTNI